MKEKIKLLAERAGFNIHNDPIDGHTFNYEIEKLAELILDECCLKLLDMDEKTKGNHNYYKHAALQLKRHFRGDSIL
jgi:hypothetical protein